MQGERRVNVSVPLLSSLYTCRTPASFVCACVRVLCKRCRWWGRVNRGARSGEDPSRKVQHRTRRSQGNLVNEHGEPEGRVESEKRRKARPCA